MSANRDDPGKRSDPAGVHTNPVNNQPVTSTSIHDRNTAGNHGSCSNTEKSTSGQNSSSDTDVWVAPDTPGN